MKGTHLLLGVAVGLEHKSHAAVVAGASVVEVTLRGNGLGVGRGPDDGDFLALPDEPDGAR